MSVFRNYNSQKAGNVNANAFPRVHPIPWVPTQNNVRANPNIPSQPQRIQPHERGTFFATSASGGGTLAPAMSSGCSGCGGCSGNGSSNTDVNPPTASEIATSSAQPTNNIRKSIAPRLQARTVGSLRPAPRAMNRTNMMQTSFLGGRGGR